MVAGWLPGHAPTHPPPLPPARRSEEAVQSLNAKLERMAQRREAAMSERTRRLYNAWQKSAQLDAERDRGE